MYTTRTIKNGIQERRCSPDLRRCMCAALAFLCALCLCVQPMRVNALVSEAILIGGTIAAFLAACGIVFQNSGLSSDVILQGLYDKFVSWNETAQAVEDVATAFAQVKIYNGYLKLNAALSDVLSSFTSAFAADSSTVLTGSSYLTANGRNITIYDRPSYATESAPYPLPDDKIEFGTGISYLAVDGYYHTLVVYRGNYYIDGVHYYLNGGSTTISGTNEESFVICKSPDKTFLWVAYVSAGDSENKIRKGIGGLSSMKQGLAPTIGTQELTKSGSVQSVPSESIEPLQDTYISPVVPRVTTLEGYVDGVASRVETNTLETTYTNATTAEIDSVIENTPPELDDYDFTTLGNLLSRKFPFSIPNDIKLAAQMLHYQAEAPVWTFQPLDVPGVPDAVAAAEVTIDLSDDTYAPWLAILRWGIVILYVAGLASATKNLIFE